VTVERWCLQREWVRAYEEDVDDVHVYRPSRYPLPPSRGRPRVTLRSGGELVASDVGPTDGLVTYIGRWQLLEPDVLELDFDGGRIENLRVLSCDAAALKVRRLSTSVP